MKKIINWLLNPMGLFLYNAEDINNEIYLATIVYEYGSLENYEQIMHEDHLRELEHFEYEESVRQESEPDPLIEYYYNVNGVK